MSENTASNITHLKRNDDQTHMEDDRAEGASSNCSYPCHRNSRNYNYRTKDQSFESQSQKYPSSGTKSEQDCHCAASLVNGAVTAESSVSAHFMFPEFLENAS